MKRISNFLCVGIMALSLATVTSCSDDDDNGSSNESNAIVFNSHVFTRACTLAEAKDSIIQNSNRLFSANALNVSDFTPFVNACRYFNDTYLNYACTDGEKPLANIITSLGNIQKGDMSSLPDVLARYKRMAGIYTANTTTKTWDKTSETSGQIVLNFPDSNGVAIKAVFNWGKPDANAPAPADTTRPMSSPPMNIISIIDRQGNAITDTIPESIMLYITGGKDNIKFFSTISFTVRDGLLKLNSMTELGDYSINITQSTTNSRKSSSTLIMKGSTVLATINKEKYGENMINAIKNPSKFTEMEAKTAKTISFAQGLFIQSYEDTKAITENTAKLLASGVKYGTEDFAKGYADILTKYRSSMVFHPVTNLFICSIVPTPYYSTVLTKWNTISYLSLYDKTTHSIPEMDPSGKTMYLLGKVETLISRLTSFLNVTE